MIESPWDDEATAAAYEEFARRYPMYRQTSDRLVALAGFGRDATVVDLACGTGQTTAAILDALGPNGHIIAVDGSTAMQNVARRAITDDRVTWIQSTAERVDQAVQGPVDAAVCNSAIWQTDLPVTAAAIARLLRPGGTFAFNIGTRFLADADSRLEAADPLPLAARAIAQRDFGWSPAPDRRRPPLSMAAVDEALSAHFSVVRPTRVDFDREPDELRAWLSIPIFSERMLPGMAYADRMAVLDQAWRHVSPARSTSSWIAFVATRATQDGGTE